MCLYTWRLAVEDLIAFDEEIVRSKKTSEELMASLVAEHYYKIIVAHFKYHCLFQMLWTNLSTFPTFVILRCATYIFQTSVPYEPDKERENFIIDWGGVDTVERINLYPFSRYGCKLKLVMIQNELEVDSLIKENFNMLSQDKINIAEMDKDHQAALENAIVVFLNKKINLLREHTNKYSGKQISIETLGSGTVFKISWSVKDEYTSLLGFRKEEDFCPKWDDETNNGKRIVDSRSKEGSIIDNLEEGKEYFYTFFLKWRDKKGNTYSFDPVRFKILSPTSYQVKSIEEQINRIEELGVERIRSEERLEAERIRRAEIQAAPNVFEKAAHRAKHVISELNLLRPRLEAEARNNPKFKELSPEQQENWLHDIRSVCEDLRDTMLGQ